MVTETQRLINCRRCGPVPFLAAEPGFRYSSTMVRKGFYVFLFPAILLLSLPAVCNAEKASPVRVYPKTTESGKYEFYVDNEHIVPVWISVEFPSLVNLKSSEKLPFRALIPSETIGQKLFTMEAVSDTGKRSYRMVVSYAKGDPKTAKPDPAFLYVFPFEHGTKHQITQGYDGAFTHSGENQYALDFDLDTGTPITAARSGLIADVKQDSNRGGSSAAYAQDANYILVWHEDGTFGNYVHLKKGGSLVKIGDRVAAGQLLGYSGNTGVSSGPHLHFDVRVPTEDGKMQSIPISFLGQKGQRLEPAEGKYFYAVHPGKPGFPMVFGDSLTDENFSNYIKEVAANGKIDVRFDRVDSTYVVYVSNGFGEPYEITVDFSLRRLVPSKKEPLTVTVPAKTEKFLLLLKAEPKATSWEYGYSVKYRPVR